MVADTSADTGAEFVADVHALALANDGPEPRADSSPVVVSDKGALLGSIGRTDTCANVSAVELADARALASPHICAVGAADGAAHAGAHGFSVVRSYGAADARSQLDAEPGANCDAFT